VLDETFSQDGKAGGSFPTEEEHRAETYALAIQAGNILVGTVTSRGREPAEFRITRLLG
jgi:hypothetical protein